MTVHTGYEPVYSDGTLPIPQGTLGSTISARFSVEQQKLEAAKMLEIIKTASVAQQSKLVLMRSPAPLLIKIPDTNTVRAIHGLAPFLGDPLAPPSVLEGTLLAFDGDIEDTSELPRVIKLPSNLITPEKVIVPTQAHLESKILEKPNDTGTHWFKASALSDDTKTEVTLAKAIPCPLFMAYDAMTEDVPAHILWERVRALELPGQTVPQWTVDIKHFLAAAMTTHRADMKSIEVPHNTFQSRMTPEMRNWGKERKQLIFGLGSDAPQGPHQGTQPSLEDLLQTILAAQRGHNPAAAMRNPQAAQTETTVDHDQQSAIMKKFGLCDSDFTRFLTLCGLTEGQEELLPEWLERLAEKGLSKNGKYAILRETCDDLIFDDNKIPLMSKTLDMIVKKAWGGEGDSITAEAVLQGLTPYTMVPKSQQEIEELNTLWQALQQATATTPADVLKTNAKLKVEVPKDFSTFYNTMRTYTNFIRCIFTSRSPLYSALKKDVVGGLALWTDQAKARVTSRSLACFTWAVYKQSRHYAWGKMPEAGSESKYVAEWRAMALHIRTGQNIDFLDLPPSLANAQPPLPPQPPATPTKRPSETNPYQGGGPSPEKYLKTERKIWIHPEIKKKITVILPRYSAMSKLCAACNITPGNIFPREINICATGAITGRCALTACTRNHNGKLITDDIATKAINVLDSVVKDPTLLGAAG